MLYHYPKLSANDYGLFRSPGPGLGNLLLPICRAAIGQSLHGGTLIHPTMAQLKLGPFVRFERDKRTYLDIFRGRRKSEWRDFLASRKLPKLSEDEPQPSGGTVVYEGLRDFFHSLERHEGVVQDWIFGNLRGPAPQVEDYDIAVHVRLGDFQANVSCTSGNSVRQSWDWYRRALGVAGDLVKTDSPRVMIFTDGNFDEVRTELGIPGATVDRHVRAIDAMIAMSRAPALVCSRSTFSMWASYLGDGYAIWDKKFALDDFLLPRPGRDHKV